MLQKYGVYMKERIVKTIMLAKLEGGGRIEIPQLITEKNIFNTVCLLCILTL